MRYLSLEKAILAVVHATRKLPHYFQAYTVVILTQLPLKSVLRSADYTGRIVKWGTILGAFDIKYIPRTSVKGQVLVDLVAEFVECPKEVNVNQVHKAGPFGRCTWMGPQTTGSRIGIGVDIPRGGHHREFVKIRVLGY